MNKIASTIEIIVGGVDITADVLPRGTSFEAAMNASPGSCQITVRDRTRVHSFTTGDEILVKLDGVAQWGGFLTTTSRKFALPVVDTQVIANVTQRIWVLRGVDFNILLDKRVLRNTADYLHHLPRPAAGTFDGTLIETALASYIDSFGTGFDTTSQVDNITYPANSASEQWAWPQQGTKLRVLFEELASFSGAVYYVGPDKVVYYKSLETQEASWGFSDNPGLGQIGFREIEAIEAGGPSGMVNDALIWGGSEWSGTGSTVFSREDNAASITEHGRWQTAETHFGETGYKLQSGVDARAEVIVNGAPGSVGGDANRGLRFPQWTFNLTWFAHDVPFSGAVREHLLAGQLVTIELETFNLAIMLPVRSLSISFVGQQEGSASYDPENDEVAFAQIRGVFGLQPGDPYTLWRYLLGIRGQLTGVATIATVDGVNEAPYGALFTGEPTPATDGATTVFQLPDGRGYIAGTTKVYQEGALLRRGVDYTESDPAEGEVTLVAAPPSTDWLWVECRIT